MKVFLATIVLNFKISIVYRANIIAGVFANLVQIITSIFLWNVIFMGENTLKMYTFKEMFSYIILINIIGFVFFPHNIFRNAELIKSGKLSNYMIRPYNINIENLAAFIGSNILKFVILIMAYISFTILGMIRLGNFNILRIILVLSNFICLFLFGQLASNLSFYLTEVWILKPLYRSLFALFSGGIFPLDILPENIYKLFINSPFAFFGFMNVKILQGYYLISDLLNMLKYSLIYSSIFYIVHVLLQRKGLQKYEGVGV